MIRIDAHFHIYPTAAEGLDAKGEVPITEYGPSDSVVESDRTGDLPSAIDALTEAGVSHAMVLNCYQIPGMPLPPDGRSWIAGAPHGGHRDALVNYNRWLCDIAADHEPLLPLVSIHPAIMNADESARHLAELADDHGARGVKLHPNSQRLYPGDMALSPTFETCAARGLPVVSHAGPDLANNGWSLPSAYAPVAERHRDLKLILAHLGGARWRDITELAETYPWVRFDLSEIIAWAGAPQAPTPAQLSALIRTIGTDRVLMGSDFPWYDPVRTIEEVVALPGLSETEQEMILGANAADLLGLHQ